METSGQAYHWREKKRGILYRNHHAICCDYRQDNILNLVYESRKQAGQRSSKQENQKSFSRDGENKKHEVSLNLPGHHLTPGKEVSSGRHLKISRVFIYSRRATTVRALSILAGWFGAPPAEDPARYSFAHGGKDGIRPVIRKHITSQSGLTKLFLKPDW